MDRSIGGLLKIPPERIEEIIGYVTAELKAAILSENSISDIKVATIIGVLSESAGTCAVHRYSTEAAFIGMMVEQAYNAAVLASKRGPVFPEKSKKSK